MLIYLILIVAHCQEELQQEEALQILRDLKDATSSRILLLDQQWKKYQESKNDYLCSFNNMLQDQRVQCDIRKTSTQIIQDAFDQSVMLMQQNEKKVQKNNNRQNTLEGLKCQQNINNIQFLKDQSNTNNLLLSLQKSVAQSSSQSLLEQLEKDNLYQQQDIVLTDEDQKLLELIQFNGNDESDIILIENSQQPLSSQKKMEKNKGDIIQVAQELQKNIVNDQNKISIDQINSQIQIERFIKQIKSENSILYSSIDQEKQRQSDLQDELMVQQDDSKFCDQIQQNINILGQLIQQDLNREQELYMNQKEKLLKEVDVYTDLLRFYLRQIYTK